MIPGLDAFVFKKVACGSRYTLAVNKSGQLFNWGCNLNQLELNSVDCTERVPRMVKVLGTSVIVQIACGVEHSIALTNDGELYAWGSNREGQLGLGFSTITEIKPKRISSLAAVPIAFIACGGYHTIVISKSGKCPLRRHRLISREHNLPIFVVSLQELYSHGGETPSDN